MGTLIHCYPWTRDDPLLTRLTRPDLYPYLRETRTHSMGTGFCGSGSGSLLNDPGVTRGNPYLGYPEAYLYPHPLKTPTLIKGRGYPQGKGVGV